MDTTINEDNRPEKTVTILPTADGNAKVGIGLGITMRAGMTDAYIKPSVFIEVTKPQEYDLNEYIELVSLYAEEKLLDCIMQLTGIAKGNK